MLKPLREHIIGIYEGSFSITKERTRYTGDKYSWKRTFDGFTIQTDRQIIKLGIDNGQNCCENWGYLMSNDDLNEFIDANFLGIEIVDSALNPAKFEEEVKLYEGDAMFVNINTSKGVLQFVAYNEHNGYYSHEAVVVSRDFNHDERL